MDMVPVSVLKTLIPFYEARSGTACQRRGLLGHLLPVLFRGSHVSNHEGAAGSTNGCRLHDMMGGRGKRDAITGNSVAFYVKHQKSRIL